MAKLSDGEYTIKPHGDRVALVHRDGRVVFLLRSINCSFEIDQSNFPIVHGTFLALEPGEVMSIKIGGK